MRDVVSLQEVCEDPAAAQRVWVEGDEDEDGRREGVGCALEVGVEVGDERAGEIHRGWCMRCC